MKKVAYPFVALALLSLALSALALFAAEHYYNASQAAERRQGQVLEAKLCTSLASLAALAPPPGDANSNPSREYLQRQHIVLAELGPDIGCPGG